MIISKEFDDSLWMILKTDKKNRKELVNFVKSIPDKLLFELQEDVKNLKDSKNEKVDIVNETDGYNGEKYSYYLNEKFLEITKYYIVDDAKQNLYILTLQRFSKDKAMLMYDMGPLATIEHNIGMKNNRLIDEEVENYDLVRSLFGYRIDYNKEDTNIHYTKPIALCLMPKNLNIK